jgi:hypothetical protein
MLLVLRGSEKQLCLAAHGSSSSLVLDDMERHPGPTIAALMKLSFDEEHRHAMCQLGGLHAVAELIQVCAIATSKLYCKCNNRSVAGGVPCTWRSGRLCRAGFVAEF